MNALKLEQHHHREQSEKGEEASSENETEKEGMEKEKEKERSEVLEREGAGLWGEKEADEVGRWLAQRLCP